VIDRVPRLGSRKAHVKQQMADKRVTHWQYIREHGDDMPEVRDWRWRVRDKST
jgi:xylulose-5-phosphate/fructose-6-phosphate phosphoketolase